MTDLVRCESLASARRTPLVRLLHRYLWAGRGDDTFAVLVRVIRYFGRLGYTFTTMNALNEVLIEKSPDTSKSPAAVALPGIAEALAKEGHGSAMCGAPA